MEENSNRVPGKKGLRKRKGLLRVLEAVTATQRRTAELVESLFMVCQLLLNHPDKQSERKQASNPREDFMGQWFDKQDVLQMLRISERSLFSLRKTGALPSYSFRGKFYYKAADVEKLMKRK